MTVVILAGGLAMRISEETGSGPKLMVEVGAFATTSLSLRLSAAPTGEDEFGFTFGNLGGNLVKRAFACSFR